jgi:hypothetical protein
MVSVDFGGQTGRALREKRGRQLAAQIDAQVLPADPNALFAINLPAHDFNYAQNEALEMRP